MSKTLQIRNFETLSYPLKGSKNGLGLYLSLTSYQYRNGRYINLYKNIHPSEVKDGFHFIIHDPFEVPSENSILNFQTTPNRTKNFSITPVLTTVDDSLIEYSPEE